MLLLDFGAALRRSELVSLRIGDFAGVPGRGMIVLVQGLKTDQHGRGRQVALWANPAAPLTCPLAALERWLTVREASPDVGSCFSAEARAARPLFCGMSKAGRLPWIALSDKAVARLVKTAADAAGLDPEKYSGHSLRAGLATAAGDQGAGLADLMRPTRHKSTEVTLSYLRPRRPLGQQRDGARVRRHAATGPTVGKTDAVGTQMRSVRGTDGVKVRSGHNNRWVGYNDSGSRRCKPYSYLMSSERLS